jgi:hypothetical protein
MLVAGNPKITDLLCVAPPPSPEGSHSMTQLVKLPPADVGPGPHRHSGPVFGYLLEGRNLFELEGQAPMEPQEIASRDCLRHPSARQHASEDDASDHH